MIEGVKVRPLKKNVDERGMLTEMMRTDWDIFEKFTMIYFSKGYPGVIRAWHRHARGQVDYFVVVEGMMKVVLYDDRPGSKTKGEVNEFFMGEDNMILLRVPGDCWHGSKVISTKPAILINMPTMLFDYEKPDEERLPYNTDKIPYSWEIKMK